MKNSRFRCAPIFTNFLLRHCNGFILSYHMIKRNQSPHAAAILVIWMYNNHMDAFDSTT